MPTIAIGPANGKPSQRHPPSARHRALTGGRLHADLPGHRGQPSTDPRCARELEVHVLAQVSGHHLVAGTRLQRQLPGGVVHGPVTADVPGQVARAGGVGRVRVSQPRPRPHTPDRRGQLGQGPGVEPRRQADRILEVRMRGNGAHGPPPCRRFPTADRWGRSSSGGTVPRRRLPGQQAGGLHAVRSGPDTTMHQGADKQDRPGRR